MTARTERRLNLLDLMVFVLMAAAGIASLRSVSLGSYWITGEIRLDMIRHGLVGPFLPCALLWTLDVLLLRLSPPRPPRRHLGRQPGMVACVAAISIAAAGAAALLLVMTVRFYSGAANVAFTDRFPTAFLEAMSSYMGIGVLVAWMMLALNKRWRPEPSWIDRMGRVVGLFWVVMLPLFGWPTGRLIF